jgi:hypothetical protein
MYRHIRLANKNIKKKLNNNTQNPQKQKSMKECSSELMLKTTNVQTHKVSKQINKNNSKTKKITPSNPKKIIEEML